MTFLPLGEDDWRLFLHWAANEGWSVPLREQVLFQGQWRPYLFALHHKGQVVGFVSAVIYRDSGWIGNLLVAPQRRGCGYGARLFDFALGALRAAGRPRIWLTASTAGAPLYQRRGFVAVDTVERWRGRGAAASALPCSTAGLDDLIDRDTQCWQESRAPLLALLADGGHLCRSGRSLGLLQPGADHWQLGPWLSPPSCPRDNRLLLAAALAQTAAGKEILCDVLRSAEMGLVLHGAGFKKFASNRLMCLGAAPPDLSGVIALASLGSLG